MKKYTIPAKTFLVGEYAALQGHPAIVLTTHPSFEVSLIDTPCLEGIHPDSPAGRFWAQFGIKDKGLSFTDPYGGLGGLGASSAQFLGAYLHVCADRDIKLDLQHLLSTYETVAWDGVGLKPSGYDVLAQYAGRCVYVSRTPMQLQTLCGQESLSCIEFILVHTGVKCATHTHLHALEQLPQLHALTKWVESAKTAIETQQPSLLADCVNAYDAALQSLGLVIPSTRALVDQFKTYPGILAAKGCGAMGADVIVVMVERTALSSCLARINELGMKVLTTMHI